MILLNNADFRYKTFFVLFCFLPYFKNKYSKYMFFCSKMYLECNQGTYGKDCLHRCGSCINQTNCHYVNGTCFEGCGPGYLGDKCVEGYIPPFKHNNSACNFVFHSIIFMDKKCSIYFELHNI